MWTATIRGLLARRVRLALTAGAVVLGVAFVTGTYVVTDTLQASFSRVFDQSAAGIDLVVRSPAPPGASARSARQRIPESVLATVRGVDGVRAASGLVTGTALFVGHDGRPLQSSGLPTIGFSWDGGGATPLRLVAGRRPRGGGEVAMDARTASRNGFRPGDTVRMVVAGPARSYRLVGTMTLGEARDLGAVTLAAFDLRTAQRLFDSRGLLDLVYVEGRPGVPVDRLAERIRSAVPGLAVESGGAFAAETGRPVREGLGFLTDALLGFAALGLFVGAFIIFNTFSILVQQRTRELALLRALGASGRQVLLSVLGEAAATGAIGALLGFVGGLGLAAGLLALLPHVGIDLPGGGLVLLGRTVVASALVGVAVTVAAAVLPARRAARMAPVAALAEAGAEGRVRASRIATGAVLLVGGAAGVAWGLHGRFVTSAQRLAVVGGGGLAVFLAVSVLTPVLGPPVARLLGAALPRSQGITGTLARNNALRNPRRTAATASALVIGLSLVVLVAVFGQSAKASVRASLASGLRADLVVTADSFSGFPVQVAAAARRVPDVDTAVGLRVGEVRVRAVAEQVFGIDGSPGRLERVADLSMVGGTPRYLDRGGILVSEREARGYRLRVGDPLDVTFPRLGQVELPVVGVFRHRNFAGGVPVDYLVSRGMFEAGIGGVPEDVAVLVRSRPGREDRAREALTSALRTDFPNVTVRDRAGFEAQQTRSIDVFLNVMVALLLLSQLIAVLGIVNTLVLSVHERTRELALLRIVGMSRRQVRRMIRGESVLIALVGSVIGTAVGLLWGWAFTRALAEQGVTRFSVPAWFVVGFVAFAAAVGVVASVAPAWRAAHLDVLEGIAPD